MMRIAHVLEEVEPEEYKKAERGLFKIKQVFSRLGYRVRAHGIEHCVPTTVEFYRNQFNKRYPNRAAFSDRVMERIEGHEGDVLVLTETWHRDCFKGLIADNTWNGLPVIELKHWKNKKVPEIIAHVTKKITELPACPNRFAFRIRNAQGITSY